MTKDLLTSVENTHCAGQTVYCDGGSDVVGPGVDDDGDVGVAGGLQTGGDAGRGEPLWGGDCHWASSGAVNVTGHPLVR